MFSAIFFILLGLAILIGGAEFLVRGASSISKRLGVSSLVIGLTVVAFSTSAPELVINIFSAVKGTTDLALGNIVGSHIANILLILGVCAVLVPLKVQQSTVWKEIPFCLLAVVVLFLMGNDIFFDGGASDVISRSEGLVMLGLFVVFLYYTFGLFKKGDDSENVEEVKVYSGWLSVVLFFGGLAGLLFGGKLFVDNAVILAAKAGMSEMLIGLTIVSMGTSLPELATGVVAAKRGQSDLAVGNIVGSCIFNILWILGITSVVKPIPVGLDMNIDFGVAILSTLVLFVVMFLGKRHTLFRWEGILFLMVYSGYFVYVILRG